jgi:peptidoglycan/LPS O-acetylase OafA/YrhL
MTSQTDPARSLGLDLVRSAAIALVLLSHCGDIFRSWFGLPSIYLTSLSGFFGVELFFVLSGFLIGRLLMDIAAMRPGFREWWVFMVRRWLRTLPLYFACLAVFAVVWTPEFWNPNRPSLWFYMLSYGSLTQNLAWPMPGWFGVTWSLTVEEWFYLLFSILFLGATVLIGRGPAMLLVLAVFLFAPLALRYGLPSDVDYSEVIQKVAVLRLDAIAYGVATAWINAHYRLDRRRPYLLLIIGAAMVLFVWLGGLSSMTIIGLNIRERILAFVITSVGFALCLPAALRLGPMPTPIALCIRSLSAQSYCIYLIHLTILEMMGFYRTLWHIPSEVLIVAYIIIIWGISYASYRWFERPILQMRPGKARTQKADEPRFPGLQPRNVSVAGSAE